MRELPFEHELASPVMCDLRKTRVRTSVTFSVSEIVDNYDADMAGPENDLFYEAKSNNKKRLREFLLQIAEELKEGKAE